MKPYELFDWIKNFSDYKTVGDQMDYAVSVNDDEKKVYLIFQQSKGKEDWINNFRFWTKVYKNQERKLLFHAGIVKAWKSGNDEVMADFTAALDEHPDYTPTIIGWSHGGGLSIIAAEDFNYRTGKKADVITFGGLKVCWGQKCLKAVKESINSCIEYAQHNDIVTYCVPLPGYHHVKRCWLGKHFSFFKIFNAQKYHTSYEEQSLYNC